MFSRSFIFQNINAYTYFRENTAFAAQYTQDLARRLLDEDLIPDIIVESVQEALNEVSKSITQIRTCSLYTKMKINIY